MVDVVEGLHRTNPNKGAELSSTETGRHVFVNSKGHVLNTNLPAEAGEGVRKIIMGAMPFEALRGSPAP